MALLNPLDRMIVATPWPNSWFFPSYGREPGIRSPFEGLKFPATAKNSRLAKLGKLGLNSLIQLIIVRQFGGLEGFFAEFPVLSPTGNFAEQAERGATGSAAAVPLHRNYRGRASARMPP